MKDPFDLPADAKPNKVQRKLRERDIQEKCVAYARSKGFWARKFSSPSQRSVPDYLFGKRYVGGYGVKWVEEFKWAEEFKAPGKHPTEAQLKEQDAMVAAGWLVYRSTGTNGQADIDDFKRRIDDMERAYGWMEDPIGSTDGTLAYDDWRLQRLRERIAAGRKMKENNNG